MADQSTKKSTGKTVATESLKVQRAALNIRTARNS